MKTSPDELVKLGFIQQGDRSMWVKDKIAVNFGLIPHIGNKFNPVIEEYYLSFKDMNGVFYHSTILCPTIYIVEKALNLIEG